MLNKPLSLIAALAVAAAALFCSPSRALAEDVIVLKDGTKVTGVITDEKPEFVWVQVKFGEMKKPRLVNRADIKEIIREKPAADAQAAATDAAKPASTDSVSAPRDGKKDDTRPALNTGAARVAIITMEEMVGPFMNADAFKHSLTLIPKDEKPDIVVMRINSGGGALFEVPKLMDLIQKDLEPNYRTVAWIESAISAAAMTALNMEEIYMMKRGNIGGATGYRMIGGKAEAISGEGLENVIKMGEQIAKNGRYDPLVIRAMQEFMPLSANIDADGRVTWQADDKGQFLVNRADRILTLNAADALKFRISKGTADTLPELMSLMGVQEYVVVGDKAAEYMVDFRSNVQKAQNELNELRQTLNFIVGNAQNLQDQRDRNREFGKARNIVDQMQAWVKRAPSLEVYEQLEEADFRRMYEMIERLRQGKSP